MPKPIVYLILASPLVAAYAMYAIGIVVIYQASRVLNLAHGAMATVPAFLVYTMVTDWHVPMGAALPLGVASGAGLGLGVERLFVRRLRSAGPTAQTVGTVAAFGVLVAVAAKIWGTAGLQAPGAFPSGAIGIGASVLRYGQIGLFVVAVVLTGLLYVLFQRTWLGLAMRGAAQNRRGAAYVGIDPDLTTGAAWALGGALAALAGILLSAVTLLHPYSLSSSVLPAFVAALIGGLESLPGTLGGAAVVGIVIGLVPVLADLPVLRLVVGQIGGAELALAVTAMVVMALRGQRFAVTDVRNDALTGTVPSLRSRTPALLRLVPARLLVVVAVGWVFIPGVPFSLLGDANQALLFTMVGVSLVLLTGWVGQISLAQAAFVGVGGFGSAYLTNHFGITFPYSLPLAMLMSAGIAVLLGIVALRVRGLYLAVATLIFAWMADSYLFSAPWFSGAGGSVTAKNPPIGRSGGYPFFDFTDRRTFYFVALAGAGLAIIALSNIRRSKTGRAFVAIRGSETAAASLGIDVRRYKLLAFALSGVVSGAAGNLIATGQQTLVAAQFALPVSLFYLSVAVVGGMQSLGGAMASSVVFAALNELFFQVDALRGWLDVVSAGLLASVLLFYPGGLSALSDRAEAVADRLRSPFARWAAEKRRDLATAIELQRAWIAAIGGAVRRLRVAARAAAAAVLRRVRRAADEAPEAGRDGRAPTVDSLAALIAAPEPVPDDVDDRAAVEIDTNGDEPVLGRILPSPPPVPLAAERALREPVLEADAVSVRFGGLVAVDDVSLSVRRGEIVGLIGPNGAGKTTLFNAVAGFTIPDAGAIRLQGYDATHLDVHERAEMGMGRTFQLIQLFGQLSVTENLLVATHTRNPTGLLSQIVVTNASVAAEADALDRVARVVDLLDLRSVADRAVAGLPFGTLRVVELARALVTGAPLVMLDEPASGLDSSETGRFAELLRFLRAKLGLSLLLIEHDVHMVLALSDYVYVIDRGKLIAEGEPADVREDPAVVAAYLGTGQPVRS